MRYSLLTVAPKERGDSGSRLEAVEVQPGPMPGSGEPAYRAILNGRAELMEILGEIFDTQFESAFYLWLWPFKHLIAHGEKLRARLSEEETKFEDVDRKPKSEASPPVADEANPRLKANRASSVSKEHADYEEDLKPKRKAQEETASQEVLQAGQDASESVHKTIDHGNKPDRIPADVETENTNAEDSSQAIDPDPQTADNTRLREELRCLVTFMDIDLKDVFSVQKDIDNGTRKLIAFDHLWQLYKPGDVVISGKGHKRAYVVLHVTGGRRLQRNSRFAMAKHDVTDGWDHRERKEREAHLAKYSKASPFVIDCFYLDFDGTKFGPKPQVFMLQEYEGEVPIASLEVFPVRFDDDPKKTEKSLVRRGRKFVKLANVDHKYYSGRTLREDIVLETTGEVGSPGYYPQRVIADFCDPGSWGNNC